MGKISELVPYVPYRFCGDTGYGKTKDRSWFGIFEGVEEREIPQKGWRSLGVTRMAKMAKFRVTGWIPNYGPQAGRAIEGRTYIDLDWVEGGDDDVEVETVMEFEAFDTYVYRESRYIETGEDFNPKVWNERLDAAAASRASAEAERIEALRPHLPAILELRENEKLLERYQVHQLFCSDRYLRNQGVHEHVLRSDEEVLKYLANTTVEVSIVEMIKALAP